MRYGFMILFSNTKENSWTHVQYRLNKTLYDLMKTNPCVIFSLDVYYHDMSIIFLNCPCVMLIHKVAQCEFAHNLEINM